MREREREGGGESGVEWETNGERQERVSERESGERGKGALRLKRERASFFLFCKTHTNNDVFSLQMRSFFVSLIFAFSLKVDKEGKTKNKRKTKEKKRKRTPAVSLSQRKKKNINSFSKPALSIF